MSFRSAEDSIQGAPLTTDHDITFALSQAPGSFVYDFNTFAWPTSLSIFGLNPQSLQLYFGPILFDDLLTGRPRYDLLPTALLRVPKIDFGLPRGVVGIQSELRTITAGKPKTELHYQAGDHRLQRITALHAQQRGHLFNRSGRFQGVFAYAGASDAGDFPGSRLQRLRQLIIRTRYQRYSWSLELLYLHNQRRLGAHSGVLGAEDVRYNRLIAEVVGQDRDRRVIRNDFLNTLKTRILTASVYLSTQSLRYTDLDASSWRIGTSLYSDFIAGRHRMRARLDTYIQQNSSDSALEIKDNSSLMEVHIGDSLKFRTGYLFAQIGLRGWDGRWSPNMRLQGERAMYRLSSYIEVGYSTSPKPASGLGRYLVNTYRSTGRMLMANTGVRYQIGRLQIGPYGFISRVQDESDYWEAAVDSVQIIKDTYTSLGTGFLLTLTTEQDRGIYATLRSGFIQTGRTQYSAELVLPKWTLSGELGFRTVLFTGDLHLDVSLRGRSWSAMTSRTLHAPTGLLVLPFDQRRPVQGSYTIDIVLKGGVRTATVYILYENLTSNTRLLNGNELVADYPLPAGQLRFGVYWPINN
ncbi:MAG: hypothetical protein OXE92_06200 [Bacteroidetes bacterium]|nr:hypothetical protein [Bacteroidota bacterium]MCY4205300.1 hypothetical protein [Bacteroidota bacterium]